MQKYNFTKNHDLSSEPTSASLPPPSRFINTKCNLDSFCIPYAPTNR